ncbi:MAG: DUF1211 domain-containing protein, partial [Bacteroidetes bacterium]|nr:DUF1211 domain-containing protein [Bacteroidota bacterium]
IAITLLALDIKITHVEGHLQFSDILSQWKSLLAFFLSFINIANFWKTHHNFFSNIKKMDEKLLWYNIFWLFFIVLLPFSTTLIGTHFFDTAAIFTYSLNTFLVTLFQNLIWDYASAKPDFLKTVNESDSFRFRLYCNLDMVNSLLAVAISFYSPVIAFIMLFTKLPMIILITIFYRKKTRFVLIVNFSLPYMRSHYLFCYGYILFNSELLKANIGLRLAQFKISKFKVNSFNLIYTFLRYAFTQPS